MKELKKENNNNSSSMNHKNEVRHAIILAAGKSQRFRDKGLKKPKVLLKIGGLRLLERSILTLREAGIEHFRITVGAYREQIMEEMKQIPRLKEMDIEYIECEDYELGNGVSFGAGADGLEKPFLLTMSDHIFSPETIKEFIGKALEEPNLPALACDPNLEEVFDMDDATKVVSDSGKIKSIGKELESYDLVDTGLFYFPAKYGNNIAAQVKAGARSVSNIIQGFMNNEGVRATALVKPMWQDVDYPGMKKEAEKRLVESIVQESDGWVSKNINRFFSTRISLWLSNFDIHPNVVTGIVFLITLIGAWLAASGEYLWIVLGAFIFQIASILDGCDGELARLTFRTSRFGEWFNKITANTRYILFFGALGLSAYRATGANIYIFANVIFGALAFYMITQMLTFAWQQKGAISNLASTNPDKKEDPENSILVDKVFSFWREFTKQDVTALLAFLLSIIFLYQVVFWMALIGTLVMAISISKKINSAQVNENQPNLFSKIDPVIFYLLGIVILCALIYNMDIETVTTSLRDVGKAVLWVFATAILWIICDTLCIANLLQYRVKFIDLIYNQLTGDAYNKIIPLAGLGGEPYKVKHLTNWLDWQTASRSVVQDRLIHSMSGILFTCLATFITIGFGTLGSEYSWLMGITAGILTIIGGGMIWITLSTAPARIAGYLLKKLNLEHEFVPEQLPVGRFVVSLFFKMLGRALNLVEIYAIFVILGIQPEFLDLVAVAAFISFSATIFFVVPQGLGVNELGISAALVLLGHPAAFGLTFGLIRRARMIFWALFGVALHVTVIVAKKVKVSRQMVKVED